MMKDNLIDSNEEHRVTRYDQKEEYMENYIRISLWVAKVEMIVRYPDKGCAYDT